MLLAFHCTGAFPWESSLLVKTNSVEYSKVYTYFIGAKLFNWGGEINKDEIKSQYLKNL